MSKQLFCLIFIVIQFFCGLSYAADNPSPCGSGYVIAFFNGVDNTFIQARESLIELRAIYGREYKKDNQSQFIYYRLFYNPTDHVIKDIAEAFKQKEQETPEIRERWELIWEGVSDKNPVDNLDPVIDFAKILAEAIISNTNPQQWVDNFVDVITQLVTERKKILAVAHSQGNLFVNAVYDRVKPNLKSDSLKVVHVASATATKRGEYTTSSSDVVIGAIRLTLSNTLEANVDVPYSDVKSYDWMGHGFLDVYMNKSLPLYNIIKDNMDIALKELQDPITTGNAGFFTVTLTWNGTGDVDLHVTEPKGDHVYYEQKIGSAGTLDVDNTESKGPEHYTLSCDPNVIQEGDYKIGINNYARATGRTASILVSTPGRIYEPIKIGVGAVKGNAGNNSPIPVCTIRVSKNSDGTFTVTIPGYQVDDSGIGKITVNTPEYRNLLSLKK